MHPLESPPISEGDNSSGAAHYGSPQFMAGSGAQISQNTHVPRHASRIGIFNPTSEGHQGFNFNVPRSGATNQPGGRLSRAWRRWLGTGLGNLRLVFTRGIVPDYGVARGTMPGE
ncbi:hypothetical protein L873DRAFT_767672 [Choiromyces venosus 120613-1]|uniref:Uncharacterized protein n=1 Tax=Choiromyces venosus 120613-1 TaxID=1336337 RepID=A0A3N4ISN1_9PEZI|nr:hypothetical protein L873DRAFT_767672 [Choiromyces venosus 120613-1]